ncbi:MAG: DUF697 domain-containing protein [Pseudomonadota bacterium]
MTKPAKNGKKIQRTRKRVYETVEPANVAEMNVEAVEILIETPTLPSVDGDLEAVEQPAAAMVDRDTDRGAKALAIVRHNTLWSAGVGVVPVPLLDMATMLALQTLMVRKLAKLYDIPYKKQRSKAAIIVLLSGLSAGYIGGGALKLIPLFGIFSFAAMPAVNAAISYAVGKVFIQHFESGGTFLDFDPKKVRGYFEEQYRQGKLSKQI